MRRLPFLVLAAVGLTLAACGGDGGGGDQEAFCGSLEALSEQVADGDLADDNGLEDALDTANELAESAEEGDQLDAVNAVRGELEDADPDNADQTAETVQDELGGFAEDCDIDEDDFAVAPTTTEAPTTTTTGSESTTGDTTGTTAGDDGGATVVSARQPVPADIAAEFAGLAQACFEGDAAGCDTLFQQTPVGSADEAYGATCGGRIPDGAPGQCASIITPPEPVPADIAAEFAALAQSCFDGDMVACDDLFRQTPAGSVDEAYGDLCGGRVPDTDAFCVDIFGERAFA